MLTPQYYLIIFFFAPPTSQMTTRSDDKSSETYMTHPQEDTLESQTRLTWSKGDIMDQNSGNLAKTMLKDAPNAKKVKPSKHPTHPCITLIPLWKKDPSNMFQWTLSLISLNQMDMTPS